MDSLKHIPSGFFDAIARIAPGSLGILGMLLLIKSTWEEAIVATLGPTAGESFAFSLTIFIFASYVLGQMIAPFAKLFQRIGELPFFPPTKNAPKGHYDYLRMHHPAQGAQCAKIRAEFTMHNGFVVVFLMFAVAYAGLNSINWLLLIPVLLAISSAIRGRTVRDTYNETVVKMFSAANQKGGT